LIGLGIAWPLTLGMRKFHARDIIASGGQHRARRRALDRGLVRLFPAWRAARMNPVDALRNE